MRSNPLDDSLQCRRGDASVELSAALFCREPDVRPELIFFHRLARGDEPVDSGGDGFQVFAHEWADNDDAEELAKPGYAAYRPGPDFDGEAGVLIVKRVEMPRDVGVFFADGADVEFVAGSVGPVSEMTVIHPAAPVMHFVVCSYTWPG